MTHLSVRAAAVGAAALLTCASGAAVGRAQCATCPTPVVAFSPVVAAPTTFVAPTAVVVQPRVGLFDRLRLRRWGVAMPVVTAPVVAAPMATTQFAAMPVVSGQMVTAGFAPAVTAMPAHVTAFAPLQRQVVQTTLMPVSTVDSCSPCATPTTVLRPVTWTPVVAASPCTTCAMPVTVASACSCPAPCAPCGTSGAVEQAAFATPSTGCSSCGVEPTYGTPAGEPATPVPAIDQAAPVGTGYPPEGTPPIDPSPLDDPAAFSAPPLIGPDLGGNMTGGPTVDVHTAVYRRPVGAAKVSASKPVTTAPAPRRAVDAGGWSTSPATR